MLTEFRFRCWALVLTTAVASGCAGLDIAGMPQFPLYPPEQPETPDQVVATWTDTVLHQPNRPAARGFGGRLTFYGDGRPKPVKVEGSLVIYAFDEEARDPSNVKPDRKYVFTKEQFAKHYSKSNLGHSYSVWIPWDKAGGPQKQISLIVRFLPEGGPVVIGEQAMQLLPGRKMLAAGHRPTPTAPPPVTPPRNHGIQLTSHETVSPDDAVAAAKHGAARRRMTCTTIPIPPPYSRLESKALRGPSAYHGEPARYAPAPYRIPSPPRSVTPVPPTAASPAARPPGREPPPQQLRFAPAESRAGVEPTARPDGGRARWQPHRGVWPSRSGPAAQPDPWPQSGPNAPNAWPAPQ